jgi:hypothetical protein
MKQATLLGAPLLGALITLSCSDDPAPPGGSGGSSAGMSSGGSSSGGGHSSGGTKANGGSGGKASGGTSAGGKSSGGNPAGGSAPAGGEGGSAGDAGGEGGAPPAVDCATVPAKPVEVKPVSGARAYHGVVFDKAGNLIGAHAGTIYKTTSDGTSLVLAAGFSDVQGMDLLPNGDLVAITSDNDGGSSLTRITPQGAQDKLLGVAFEAYGVRAVPSGWVYYAEGERLAIFNPTTKQIRNLDMPVTARVLDYSPDRKHMYVGTLTSEGGIPPVGFGGMPPEEASEKSGVVYVFDLDEGYLPKGEPRVFAQDVGGGFHDGLGVDACGNLFVADYDTSALYRVTSDGKVSLFQQWTTETYGHALAWGSGVGGWDRQSLYQPQPYNNDRVVKVAVGVPARPR